MPPTEAEAAIAMLETHPSNVKLARAIIAIHQDLKADVSGLKADVGRLLDHFGLNGEVSGPAKPSPR